MQYAKVLKLPQYFRNLQRLGEIVRVLVKHGFGDLVSRLDLYSHVETGLRVLKPSMLLDRPSNLDFGTRLRLVCEELGPTFIKFGQLVATRPDIFPDSITAELRKLQDRVPAFSVIEAKKAVQTELGRSTENVFESFDEIPLAAASIAQVHRAKLRSGEDVVVKIKRPNIDRVVDTDLDIVRGIAALIEEHIPESRFYSPSKLVEEFARGLKLECDFRREAVNMRRFATLFKSEPGLVVPKVYAEYSSRAVLTEEFIDGDKVDSAQIKSCNFSSLSEKVEILARVVLSSIFEHRFFHADPHPGNVLVTPDGRVALIDFGSMGRLDRGRASFVIQFLEALFTRNLEKVVRMLVEAEMATVLNDEISLKNQIAEILDHHLSKDSDRLKISRLLGDVFEVVRRHGVRPPADILLVGKSLTLVEHVAALLDPSNNPMQFLRVYLRKRYLAIKSDPRTYSSYMAELGESYNSLVKEAPNDLRLILKKLARENLTIRLSDTDLHDYKRHQSRLVNRVIMTAIGLALLTLGVLMFGLESSQLNAGAAYAFIALGALVVFFVWMAVRRSGGT